jgi:hypothetical protein
LVMTRCSSSTNRARRPPSLHHTRRMPSATAGSAAGSSAR